MEAFSAIESTRSRRVRFTNLLAQHIKRVHNEFRTPQTASLASSLEVAISENDKLIDDAQKRLLNAVEVVSTRATVLADSGDALRLARTPLSRQLTDHMILATILSHAKSVPDEEKRLFTGNRRDFECADLRDAGVEVISSLEDTQAWMKHLVDGTDACDVEHPLG